jgi:selenocysteine lyase/cysteine desulfurase
VDVEAMAALVHRHAPRLVALTHVPTSSGLVQPIAAVGSLCRDRNLLYLVDACQSVGQLPIDVSSIGCDFLSATSRKFLRGPRGSGFLFVADRVLDTELAPLFVDLRGASWTAGDVYALQSTARRFENWEFAYALVLGVGKAARYARDVGLHRIAQRTQGLAGRTRAGLRNAGLRVLDRGPALCGIVTVEIPDWEAEPFHQELEWRGVNSSVSTRAYAVFDFTEKGVAWALRVSPHYYNTEHEVDEAVSIIDELARRGPGLG